MDLEKQKLLLSCLTANRDILALTSGILKPEYFDPLLKPTATFILEYFKKYKDQPKNATVKAETGVELEIITEPLNKGDVQYISAELETFCQQRAIEEAIKGSPKLLAEGDYGKIISTMKEAISVSLQKDLGLDYFDNPEERLKVTLAETEKYSTGIPELDEAMGGGISRQELLTILANSGGGKSVLMLNIGKYLCEQGLNGVYISLEMAESIVSKRLDSMFSGIATSELHNHINKVADVIIRNASKCGDFRIKRFAENRTTIADIHSWLQQLEQNTGFRPDFIIVDYIDIMGTTHKVSYENMFTKDKLVTEEIRSLGFDYNAIVISASQLGRNAIEAEKLNQGHIQGGISKINTSDYVVGIKRTDVMIMSNEALLEMIKSRNATSQGKTIAVSWNTISQVIKGKTSDLTLVKKQDKGPALPRVNMTTGRVPSKGADVMALF